MKNGKGYQKYKKKVGYTAIVLILLVPNFFSSSFVIAEEIEQSTPSLLQGDEEETDTSTLESSSIEETLERGSIEKSSITDTTIIQETTDTTNFQVDDLVTILDPYLKQEIISALGLPAESNVTKTDMKNLTSLTINSSQIASLSGLEYATNLELFYDYTDNNVTDFSPLEQLSSLRQVTLQTISLTSDNFPDLSNNIDLVSLHLSYTSLDNSILNKLAQLTQLTRIDLDSNVDITTIEPLKVLPNLKRLSVQFCGITDFTVINEFPVLNNLAASGQSTGLKDLPTSVSRSSLDYNLEQQTLFLPFSMMPNRMTNFDGYIPPFTTSNAINDTTFDINGEQLPVDRLQITDQGITILGISTEEFKNLSSFSYSARLNNPYGSYEKPEGFGEYYISAGRYLHQFYIVEDGKPLTIYYKDTEGKELLPTEIRTGLVGEMFDIIAQDITDYELKEAIGNTSGSFTNQEQTLTFVYKKISNPIVEQTGKVIVHYVDTDNNTIKDDYIMTGAVGTIFETEKPIIEGFVFKEVQGATKGTFNKEDQEVTYIFTKEVNTTELPTDFSTMENLLDTPLNSSSDNNKTKTSNRSVTTEKLPVAGEQSNNVWLFIGLFLIGCVSFQIVLKKYNTKD